MTMSRRAAWFIMAMAACLALLAGAQAAYANENDAAGTPVEPLAVDTSRSTASFSDLKVGAWYTEYVDYVASHYYMNGYADGTFRPDNKLTRGQIVYVLWTISGSPVAEGVQPFKDVDYSQYYGDAINWARANGVVDGRGNNNFAPGDSVTRQALSVILFRFAQAQGLDTYTDGRAISDIDGYEEIYGYAYEAMSWCYDQGIVTGSVDATGMAHIYPQQALTRIHAAKMITIFYRDSMLPAREREVLDYLQGNLQQHGFADQGWSIQIGRLFETLAEGYYITVPSTMTLDELRDAYRTDAQLRSQCATLTTQINGMTGSAREYALWRDVDLPVYGVALTTDGKQAFLSVNGETRLPFASLLAS